MRLFSVYDKKAGEFGPLFESKNEDTAIRQFKNMLASERAYAPEDYNLYVLGEFNRDTGAFVLDGLTFDEKRILFSGESLVMPEKEIEVRK